MAIHFAGFVTTPFALYRGKSLTNREIPHKQGESLVSMSHNKKVQWFQSRHTVTASLKLATSQGDDVTARVEEDHCSVYIGGRVASYISMSGFHYIR